MTISVLQALNISVSAEDLLGAFDAVQQTLILESWIGLDVEAQNKAKQDVVNEAVSYLAADGMLHDILVNETQPRDAFLCHARREIARALVTHFGIA